MTRLPIDADYERPIHARYLDPVELVWLAACERLGITLRRDPSIFSRTDGSGMLWLGPRSDLDPDDSLCQMLLHELCHWVTNGVDTFHERDWGCPLDDLHDLRELSCLRVQAWLADQHGLRAMLGPTGLYRQYFDRIPADALEPLDDSELEADVAALAREAVARTRQPPFHPHLHDALAATAKMAQIVAPFLNSYATEVEGDTLPSLWDLTRRSPEPQILPGDERT